jgi:hypothetical protein
MYRLFSRIPKGLEPVADAFKRHVEADGMALVKEATEAAAAKAAAGKLSRRTCMPISRMQGPCTVHDFHSPSWGCTAAFTSW